MACEIPKRFRNLFVDHSAEVPHFDDLRLSGIDVRSTAREAHSLGCARQELPLSEDR